MTQTTVILGAGASADFDLPLGDGLLDLAEEQLVGFKRKFEAHQERSPGWQWNHLHDLFYQDLVKKALVKTLERSQSNSVGPLFELITVIQRTSAYSIDTLALENPEYLEICKTLASGILTSKIQGNLQIDRTGTEIWNFAERKITNSFSQGQQANWIHLFTSMMRNAYTQNREKRYKVISFNYDKIFEMTLRRVWGVSTRELIDIDEFVEFTYPHGLIDWTIDTSSRSRFSYDSSHIEFAHNKSDKTSFDLAREFIADATDIISLGFSFAPENIDSLGLKESVELLTTEPTLIYQNFDGNLGVNRRVNELPVEAIEFRGPISQAIQQGQLGDLPS